MKATEQQLKVLRFIHEHKKKYDLLIKGWRNWCEK